MSNSSIWPIDRTLSGAITPDLRKPGSDGNEGILCIPQSSSITGALSSNYFVLYAEHSLVGVGSYPCAEKQPVYSTAPADWAAGHLLMCVCVGGSYLSGEMQSVYSTATPKPTGLRPVEVHFKINSCQSFQNLLSKILFKCLSAKKKYLSAIHYWLLLSVYLM